MIGKTNIAGKGLSFDKPLLHIYTRVGSTITISYEGSAIKQVTPQMLIPNIEEPYADYCYTINKKGNYFITATLGYQTQSKTITIDENIQYNVKLTYSIYDEGNYLPGYAINLSASAADIGTINSNRYIQHEYKFLQSVNIYASVYWYLNPAVDLTNFSKIRFRLFRNEGRSNVLWYGVANSISNNTPIASLNYSGTIPAFGDPQTGEWVELDITNLTGEYYIKGYMYVQGGDTVLSGVYEIQLEE